MAPRKTCVAFVRLSPSDHAEIRRRARRAGLSVSAYLARAGLGLVISAPVPAVNKAAWSELARTAANLNQLAHHLNRVRMIGRPRTIDPEILREELRRLYGHILVLRRLLLGEDRP